MPMPSLFKYFAFVGACLLGLLTLTNFLLDPSTGATNVAAPKPTVAIQHDPRASKIERWRVEQAALKAAEQTPAGENASLVNKSTPEPYRPASAAQAPAPQAVQAVAKVEPAQPHAAPAQMQSAEAPAIAGVETEEEAAAARAAKLAEDKAARIAKAKVRKERLARERARSTTETAAAGDGGVPVAGHYGYARERTASNTQDQYYYGQRAGGYQPPPGSAFAPRQNYGPFGWGRGW